MGIFGGIGKALKGVDWGKVMSNAQAAGAIAHGDYGTAAQIQDLRQQRQHDQATADAKAQQAQAVVAALVAKGIPEQEARALVTAGAADSVLANRYNQQPQNEYTYFDDNAGNRWRQNTRTGEVDANPTFIDRNPKQYIQDGQLITVPNSYAGGQQSAQPQGAPQPGQVVNGYRFKGGNPNDQNAWEPVSGGGASNGAGTFPGFQRLPGGGQFRLSTTGPR